MDNRDNLFIKEVSPLLGVPGGEIVIDCQGFNPGISSKVLFGEVEAFIVSASSDRIIVRLPESLQCLGMALQSEGSVSAVFPFNLAARLAAEMHPVANPVVAPDGTLITTISGSRGRQVAQPLIRITKQGEKTHFPCEIMNPTGLAFSKDGQLYISSRNDGTVLRYMDFEQLEIVADDLGIPCGLAFDSKGLLYVGDRTGKIYRIDPSGAKEEFALLESSVSAYHLAIDSEDRLYVTGPTFSMRDNLYRISKAGEVEILISGLARPQGMAFLPDGDLLLTAGFQGKKGIFKYSPKSGDLQHYIAATTLVGLALAGQDIFLADGSSIFLVQLPGRTAKVM
jgi:sugar lactone lactonase YvrE